MRAAFFSLICVLCAAKTCGTEPEEILRSKSLLVSDTLTDVTRVGIYNDLAWEYSFSDFDSAQHYIGLASRLSNRLDDPYWRAVTIEMEAILAEISGRSEDALKRYLEVIPLRESIGGRGLENTYNNMAVIFRNQENYQKAYKYFRLSYEIELENENAEGIAASLINMALVKMRSNEMDSVPHYFRKAARITEQSENLAVQAVCYLNFADFFSSNGAPDSASYYYNFGYKIADEIGDLGSMAVAAYGLSEVYYSRGDYDRALTYLDESEHMAEKVNSAQYLKRVHGLRAEVFSTMGRFKEAFGAQKRYQAAKDSLLSSEILNVTNSLEAKYESERKDRQIAELRLSAAQRELEAEAERNRRNILLFFTALMVLGIAFIAYRYRHRQRMVNILSAKNKTIEAALRDRETLLKEIHHRVKNNLQVVSSLLSIQGREITDAKALEAVNESKNRVKSMALIHQYLYGDNDLKSIDMQQYVVQLSKSLFSAYKVDHDLVVLRTEVEPILLDVDTAVPLGIILNELVTNALKYAFPEGRPGTLTVSLKELNGKLELRVKDDGVGLEAVDPSDLSFGMKLLNAFKSKLNAEFETKNENGAEAIYTIGTYKRSWAETTAS